MTRLPHFEFTPAPRKRAWDRLANARNAALGVMSSASGYYTFKGVATLLQPEGTDVLVKAGAVVFALAVTAGIWIFWYHCLEIAAEAEEN